MFEKVGASWDASARKKVIANAFVRGEVRSFVRLSAVVTSHDADLKSVRLKTMTWTLPCIRGIPTITNPTFTCLILRC